MQTKGFLALPLLATFAYITINSHAAFAEETYKASCISMGDGITLVSTGELVLEQRLVSFKPLEPTASDGKGVCLMRKDPPGYRWVPCWKRAGRFATGDWENPYWINPSQALVDSVLYRGWSGACKVKL
jgi:hypothetical protein